MNHETDKYISIIVALSEAEIDALENLELLDEDATTAIDKICDEARFLFSPMGMKKMDEVSE